jgi:hypothetical protein
MIPRPSERFTTPPDVTDDELEMQISKAIVEMDLPTATADISFPPPRGRIGGQREVKLVDRAKALAEAAGWLTEIVNTRGSGPILRIKAPR